VILPPLVFPDINILIPGFQEVLVRKLMEDYGGFNPPLTLSFVLVRGAQYLTGENLEVVWAEFSTLS